MAFDPEAIAANAGARLSSINETMLRVKYDPPSFSLRTMLVVAAVFVVAQIGVYFWTVSSTNAHWRERIAQASPTVREKIRKAGDDVVLSDQQIVEGMLTDDQNRKLAEQRLAELANAKPLAGRDVCVVPAHCLRKQ